MLLTRFVHRLFPIQLSSAWAKGPTHYYPRERAGRDGRMLAARVEPKNGPNVRKDGIIAGEQLSHSRSYGSRRQSFWNEEGPH
jgi:hypothetical protein